MSPLFNTIIEEVPPFLVTPNAPLQIQVAALDYDNHLGQIAIGRVHRGIVEQGTSVVRVDKDGNMLQANIDRLYVFQNLEKVEVTSAYAGEIVALNGIQEISIGDTIADPISPEALPAISIDEPTLTITIGVNTSPFAGREGNAITARQLHARLTREIKTNVSLHVETTNNPSEFKVSGRGELHLGVLLETLRREGNEIQASRPQAIVKTDSGQAMEPYEMLFIDTDKKYIGALTENLAKRMAKMDNLINDEHGNVHLEFKISTRGLIGFHNFFLKMVHGDGVMNTEFLGYEPIIGELQSTRTGALVASEDGVAVTYGLGNAQERGITFIEPGTQVYEGMVIGTHQREKDIVVNVCKEKKQTNIRSSTSDIAVRLTPPTVMNLEESLDFIVTDELVEITPSAIRIRKKLLNMDMRRKETRDEAKSLASNT
jgi:GTP-binding protein